MFRSSSKTSTSSQEEWSRVRPLEVSSSSGSTVPFQNRTPLPHIVELLKTPSDIRYQSFKLFHWVFITVGKGYPEFEL